MRNLLATLLLLASVNLFAALATPTAITSVSVVGSTVTVNSTAHALTVNQGFCISASSVSADNVCGVVVTSALNSFTFTQSGLSACAATCGTVAQAKHGIVLSVSQPSQGQLQVTYVLWLTTQQPIPGASKSVWGANLLSAGPSQAENNAIAAGYFVEVTKTASFPSNALTTDIQTYIANDWIMSQQALANNIQPGQWYGFCVDSIGWARL